MADSEREKTHSTQRRRLLTLAMLAMLGGCASQPPTQAALRGQPVAASSTVVPCSTTYLVLATVSKCGSGGLRFGVGTE